MSQIHIANLSSQNANWLATRQSIIASNIANANTPDFQARDVRKLEAILTSTHSLAKTDDGHINANGIASSDVETAQQSAWDVYHSGGNVSLAQEMLKSGEVASAYQLNTSVMKSFHRMVISVFGS